jgi:hypothetical protein
VNEPQTLQYVSPKPASFADRLAAVLVQVFPRIIGGLLIWYAINKLRAPESIETVLAYDGFPAAWLRPIAYAVIGAELLLGAMLLAFRWWRMTVTSAAIILLTIYTAQLGYLLTGADAPACSCGGEQVLPDEDSIRRSNLLGIVRNILLIVPAAWVLLQLYLSKPPAAPAGGAEVGLPSSTQ